MTNPHVAKAVAASYLTELYKALPEETEVTVEQLVEHTLANVRDGHDGYPVIKLIGKNRLAIEFDLDVKPFSEAAVVDEDHGEAGRELLADAHTPGPESSAYSDGYPLPGESDAAGESDDPQGHAETYGETGPGDTVDNPWADEPSAREEIGGDFKDLMNRGDAARDKATEGAAGN